MRSFSPRSEILEGIIYPVFHYIGDSLISPKGFCVDNFAFKINFNFFMVVAVTMGMTMCIVFCFIMSIVKSQNSWNIFCSMHSMSKENRSNNDFFCTFIS